MKASLPVLVLAVAVVACTPKSSNEPTANNVTEAPNSSVPPTAAPTIISPVANDQAAEQAAPPKTSLPEPKGPIDPKSTEAAGQVVQHYGALIEQKRWTESRQYWGDAGAAQAFERNFQAWKNVHLEIGNLGPAEGAAGSIFTNMPVRFYGDLNKGGTGQLKGNVVLRRVNDVDGSTEAQRRWHIERIETK
jgi:hypothetical protein